MDVLLLALMAIVAIGLTFFIPGYELGYQMGLEECSDMRAKEEEEEAI